MIHSSVVNFCCSYEQMNHNMSGWNPPLHLLYLLAYKMPQLHHYALKNDTKKLPVDFGSSKMAWITPCIKEEWLEAINAKPPCSPLIFGHDLPPSH
jgi:hypothetical protein